MKPVSTNPYQPLYLIGITLEMIMNSIADALNLSTQTIAGPAWVTLAYLGIYGAFMVNLARVKIGLHRKYHAKGQRFDRYFGQDREMLVADRIQLNMLEFMPVFLTLLWLHALVVSSIEATILGATYTLTRAIYPLLLSKKMGKDIPPRLLIATFSGYFVLTTMAVRIMQHL